MLKWGPQFETGHRRVDDEHREVLHRLERLNEAIAAQSSADSLTEYLVTLRGYVLGHFAHEEAYMLRVGCSAYEANCRAHTDFTLKFAEWIERLSVPGAAEVVAKEIHRETTAWIESHIMNCDCQLRGCSPR